MTPTTCPGGYVPDRPGWMSGLPSPACPIYKGEPCPHHGPAVPEQDRPGYPEAYVSAHGSLLHPALRTLSLMAETSPYGVSAALRVRLWPFLYQAMCDAHEDVDVPAALLAEVAPYLSAWQNADAGTLGRMPNTWRVRHVETLAALLSDHLAELANGGEDR